MPFDGAPVPRLTQPDWFRIITDLIYAGLPMRQIGREIDVTMSEALLRAYRSGTQPTYVRGEALVKLWCAKLGKSVDEVPRKAWYPPTKLAARRNRGLR